MNVIETILSSNYNRKIPVSTSFQSGNAFLVKGFPQKLKLFYNFINNGMTSWSIVTICQTENIFK